MPRPSAPDDFMEIYSPPRIAAEFKGRQMNATISADIFSGWNLTDPDVKALLFDEIEVRFDVNPILDHRAGQSVCILRRVRLV